MFEVDGDAALLAGNGLPVAHLRHGVVGHFATLAALLESGKAYGADRSVFDPANSERNVKAGRPLLPRPIQAGPLRVDARCTRRGRPARGIVLLLAR